MHLVKWLRKNQSKVMAWVVILLMISFVGGYGLQQLLSPDGGVKSVVGEYDGEKIRQIDIMNAKNELDLLQGLMAEQLLFSRDLNSRLLGLILFPNNQMSSMLHEQFIQAIDEGQVQLSREQIDRYFSQIGASPELMWILLKAEAKKAGVVVSAESARASLGEWIPRVTQDMFGQPLDPAGVLFNLSQRTGLTDQQIANVFADLLSVLKYGEYIFRNHVVTYNEMQSQVLRQTERVSGEYYVLDAKELEDEQPEPSQEAVQTQFAQYRDTLPDNYSDDNPYGFGYRIPQRTAVEYLFLDLGQVQEKIDPVTPEDLEQYYSRNLSSYQTQVPVDPSNPEAGTKAQQRPFAQVAGQIRQTLERERTQSLATRILNEVREKTEAGFEGLEQGEVSVEQLQQAAGEYTAAAKAAEDKYGIPVQVGATSPLRPQDFASDMILGGMVFTGPDDKQIRLRDIVYRVSADGSPIRQIGLPTLRMWENVSPLMGGYFDYENSQSVRLMGMVRVTEVIEPQVPESLEVQFAIESVRPQEEAPESYSVREQVVSDLKLKAAMENAQQRAQTLVSAVEQENWDSALESYRRQYAADADPNDPATADLKMPKLRMLSSQTVVPQSALTLLQRQMDQPGMAQYVQSLLRTRSLYSVLDPGQESTGTVAEMLVFPPAGEILIAKELTREQATEKDFADSKDLVALQTAFGAVMDLGLVHYNPENVRQRMAFVLTEREETPVEEENRS